MLTQIGFMHFMQEDFGCINHHHQPLDYQPVPMSGMGATLGVAPRESGDAAGLLLVYKKLAALAAGVGCMSVLAIWG